MKNVKIEVIVRVTQDTSYLDSRALSEATISQRCDIDPSELSSALADRMREAKVLADDRLNRFAREELSREQREREQTSERNHAAEA